MRRTMFLLAMATASASAFAAPAVASAAETCTAASSATFRHTFNGNSGQATISAVRPLCAGQTQSFGLVAYTAGTGNAGQFTYSADRGTISSTNRSITLDVVVPPCYAQVDAILGNELIDEVTSSDNPYGARTLGASGSRSSGPPAHYRGGSTECSPAPKVTFTNACDGTYSATLANAPGANVSATFLVSGRLTRLAPGRSTKVKGPAGGSLTIRDSSFTTYVGTWRPPTSGCTSTTTTAPPSAPAAAPTNAPSVAAPPSAPALPTATLTATADAPAAVFVPPPTTAAAQASAIKKAMSASSIIAIAFGLVLIGGGSILLVRVVKSLRDPA